MNHLTDFQLNEYLDAALPSAARRRAEGHLQTCTSCRARLAELEVVFSELAALPEARLSRDLTGPVLARLPQKLPRLWTPGLAAQAGAALGTFIWLAGEAVRAVGELDLSFSLAGFPEIPLPRIAFTLPEIHFSLPAFQFIDLSAADISTFSLALLIASAGALWVVGNAALLRSRTRLEL